MTTGITDDHVFTSQCSIYDSPRVRSPKETRPVLGTPSMPSSAAHRRQVKYPTQASMASPRPSTNSIHHRHSGSADLMSVIRSLALKPFKASSMTDAVAGGQTSNVISGSQLPNKSSVNLLRYRPLSDVLPDQTSFTQSTSAVEDFVKRMGWSTDETRVKGNTAMKFLIASSFNVNRAIDLYRTHDTNRKAENLDHIWINNPHLIREIQSSKFFALPLVPNQPLPIVFTMANHSPLNPIGSLAPYDQELITLQAFVCQLDAATESLDVQNNGLNFIYDMQQCPSSPVAMNLSKKIMKLFQSGYPAILKNIFVISAPKWFRVVHKVTLFTPDQMRECLIKQYGYGSDTIPVSLGGTFDPVPTGDIRYRICLSKVTSSQSICYRYYSSDYEASTSKSTNQVLFFNTDHHDRSIASPKLRAISTQLSSLVAIVSLKNHHRSSSHHAMQKRESPVSPSSFPAENHDKRQRSNASPIEEELPFSPSSYLRNDDPLNSNGHTSRLYKSPDVRGDSYMSRIMPENDTREAKRSAGNNNNNNNNYRALNEAEFLVKSQAEIRQEFHKMPNPPAKDPHAAREEHNLDKSRYRDVIPGESTRVKLQPDDVDDNNDFINANYVTGYNNEEKAYIFTQGPLQSTEKDFWRMIWQENISIIVMTTNLRESGMNKCYPYWPAKTKESLDLNPYQIVNEKSEAYDSFVVTTLLLRKKNQPHSRTIYHAHYLKWPDHGIPVGTRDALLFLEKVEGFKQLAKTKAPVLLHCSAGIGRTGTFCAIDIGIKRYLDTRTIDVPSTVVKMRSERAGSVQTEDQYVFVHLALMDYIKQQQRPSTLDRMDHVQETESDDDRLQSPSMGQRETMPRHTKSSNGGRRSSIKPHSAKAAMNNIERKKKTRK